MLEVPLPLTVWMNFKNFSGTSPGLLGDNCTKNGKNGFEWLKIQSPNNPSYRHDVIAIHNMNFISVAQIRDFAKINFGDRETIFFLMFS